MGVAWLIFVSLPAVLLLCRLSAAYNVMYAVNCGGGKHTDRFGIRYTGDDNPMGIPSDFGLNLAIGRVHPEDMVLYQTERYHTGSFSYSTSLDGDGDYFLILKFAEVYFGGSGQKVGILT